MGTVAFVHKFDVDQIPEVNQDFKGYIDVPPPGIELAQGFRLPAAFGYIILAFVDVEPDGTMYASLHFEGTDDESYTVGARARIILTVTTPPPSSKYELPEPDVTSSVSLTIWGQGTLKSATVTAIAIDELIVT